MLKISVWKILDPEEQVKVNLRLSTARVKTLPPEETDVMKVHFLLASREDHLTSALMMVMHLGGSAK